MAAKKGNNYGRQFSNTNQPRSNGRKSSRLNEFADAFSLNDDDKRISNEDMFKLLKHLLSCSMADIEVMARHPDLPIAILNLIKAIMNDLSQAKTNTVDKLFDRVYGKTPMQMERKVVKGLPLIPSRPMSRLDYQKLLEELQGKK